MLQPEFYGLALEKEFQLVYHGKFTYGDIQRMPAGERDWHYNKLIETKTKEREAWEEAQRNIPQVAGRGRRRIVS